MSKSIVDILVKRAVQLDSSFKINGKLTDGSNDVNITALKSVTELALTPAMVASFSAVNVEGLSTFLVDAHKVLPSKFSGTHLANLIIMDNREAAQTDMIVAIMLSRVDGSIYHLSGARNSAVWTLVSESASKKDLEDVASGGVDRFLNPFDINIKGEATGSGSTDGSESAEINLVLGDMFHGKVEKTTVDPNTTLLPLVCVRHANAPNGTVDWYISTYRTDTGKGQTAISASGTKTQVAVRHAVNNIWPDTWTWLTFDEMPVSTIPNLDASKITSGIFNVARIPNMDAAKINSGIFAVARIPVTNHDTTGLSGSSTKLATPRKINGTDFDGTKAITTASWGTARVISISGDVSGSASIDGSKAVDIKVTLDKTAVDDKLDDLVATGVDKLTSEFDIRVTGEATGTGSTDGSKAANIALTLADMFHGKVVTGTVDPNLTNELLISTRHANTPTAGLDWYIVTYKNGTAKSQIAVTGSGANTQVAARHSNDGTVFSTWIWLSNNQLTVADIPNLPATKVNSGVFDVARIPNLNASKITAGVFDVARIPVTNHSTTGLAGTATKLATPRLINGTNFDGSADINTARWGLSRTLTVNGLATGTVAIDGSKNVSLTLTLVEGILDDLLSGVTEAGVNRLTNPFVINIKGEATGTASTDGSTDANISITLADIFKGKVVTGTADPNTTELPLICTKHANAPNATDTWYVSTYRTATGKGQLAVTSVGTVTSMAVRHTATSTFASAWIWTSNNKLTAADIPNLSTAKLTSGTLPLTRGGTGGNSKVTAQASLGIGTMGQRDVFISTADPDNGVGEDGDIWMQYT